MTESAPFSPADRNLLAGTPYASCENLADAGRLLASIVPKHERALGADPVDVRQENPLPPELLRSLSDDVLVQQFYRTHAHFLFNLGLRKDSPSYGHNSGHRSKLAKDLKVLFTEDRPWFSVDIRRFVRNITETAIETIILCIQKLLVVLLRINFRFKDFGSNTDRTDLTDELQNSQRHLCRSLIENAVDARGVHNLLRDALIERLTQKIESAIEETRILEESAQLKDSELYQVVARSLDRDVAAARPVTTATKSESRVPTTRLSDEELDRVVQVGNEHPWSSRTVYRTDPVDWLDEHYRNWIGHGLVQTDLKKADFNFYFALKRRMAKGNLPGWLILPGTSDIRQQNAVDNGVVEQHDRLRAVERLRSRLYRERAQPG